MSGFADDLSFIAHFAAERLNQVPHEERAQLLQSLSTVFKTAGDEAEAEQCAIAADAILTSDGAQMILSEMVKPGARKS